jgi:hypothetical protein
MIDFVSDFALLCMCFETVLNALCSSASLQQQQLAICGVKPEHYSTGFTPQMALQFLFHVFLTLADFAWSQVINLFLTPRVVWALSHALPSVK